MQGYKLEAIFNGEQFFKPKFFYAKIFLRQNFFTPKFFTPIFFYAKKPILRQKTFFTPIFLRKFLNIFDKKIFEKKNWRIKMCSHI